MRLYVIFDKFRRYWRQIRMLTIRDGWKKMDYIKKHNMFAQVGENCYFQSNILPAEPFLLYLHNNGYCHRRSYNYFLSYSVSFP